MTINKIFHKLSVMEKEVIMKIGLTFIMTTAFLSALALADIVRVPQDQATVQEGINAAVNGDTVLVGDSTYYENINFKGKAITVASYFIMDDDAGHISNTIIDGSQPSHPDSGSAVYFISGEDTNSVLCGLTITGGNGTPFELWTNSGSGNGESMVLKRRSWKNGAREIMMLYRTGGGIFCTDITGVKLKNNRIIRNQVSGNNAAGGGMAFYSDSSILILEDNHFLDNNVTGVNDAASGGIDIILGSNSYVRITGNFFERDTVNCQHGAYSGALWVSSTSDTILISGLLRENVFRENTIKSTGWQTAGGAVYCLWTTGMEFRDNLFENNASISSPGYFGQAGAIFIEDHGANGYGSKLVVGNTFIGNRAKGAAGRGGAILLFNTTAILSGNYFYQNKAQPLNQVYGARGGAISIYQSSFLIENNIFSENTSQRLGGANYGLGGAIHVSGNPQSGSEMTVMNNTFVNNSALSYGGGIYAEDSIKVINSIFWGNTPDQLSGYLTASYCDIQGGWTGTGTHNKDADPLFADTIEYKLSPLSPCIGAGIDSIEIGSVWYYAPPTDKGGNARPMPASTMPDMGAWEDQIVGLNEIHQNIPLIYSLSQNYPNPFNPTTAIEFAIPKSEFVTLRVYNILGEEVATLVTKRLTAGSYKYDWDASSLASGVYLYRIKAGDYVETRKMVLIK
jgi:predicted outer membrane repeat protein